MRSHKYLLLKMKLVKKVFLKLTVLKAENWRNQIDESFPLLCDDTQTHTQARTLKHTFTFHQILNPFPR